MKKLALLSIVILSLPATLSLPALTQSMPAKDKSCIQRAHNARVKAKQSIHARTKAGADRAWLAAVKACPNETLFNPGKIGSPLRATTGSGSR